MVKAIDRIGRELFNGSGGCRLSRCWGMVLELVASCDIGKNKEVLIDYGRDWQRAWSMHDALFDPAWHGGMALD